MNCTIIIQATAVAEPVRSSSSANTATELNQSPSCEMVCPMNSRRKFRLCAENCGRSAHE